MYKDARWWKKVFDVKEFANPTMYGTIGHKIQITNKAGDWIGHITTGLHPTAKSVFVDNAGVTSEFAHTGIGRYLYSKALHNAQQQGAHHFTSDPSHMTSQQAQRMWAHIATKRPTHYSTNSAQPMFSAALKKEARFLDNVDYAWYVGRHKANIVSPMMQMQLPLSQALKHDLSKLTPTEFRAYRDWFNGPKGLHGTRDPETHKKWRAAVELHYTRNPHHWKKRGEDWHNVPLKYREESVADWYSVGKTIRPKGTKFPSFKEWYSARQANLPIDPIAKADISKKLGLAKQAMDFGTTRQVLKELAENGIKVMRSASPISSNLHLGKRVITVGKDSPRMSLFHEVGHYVDALKGGPTRHVISNMASPLDALRAERSANHYALDIMKKRNVSEHLQKHYRALARDSYATHRNYTITQGMKQVHNFDPRISEQVVDKAFGIKAPDEGKRILGTARILDKFYRKNKPGYLKMKRNISHALRGESNYTL